MDFETIILRFRDLVTEYDETIKHHKNKIEENGCVWWGWWNKGNEQTPFDEFSVLMGKVNEEPIYFYLLDSGQERLYKAKCTAIKYNRTEKLQSPEIDNTPLYYNAQKYYAWFKFDDIVTCDIEELRNYTYVAVDSLFKENTSNYQSFNNKRIYDAQELIRQNRTLWFVRPYNKESDKDYEIQLLDSNFVEPNNFSKRYYETKSDTLLWLSDLHFKNDSLFKIKVKNETDTTLTKHLQNAYDGFQHLGGLIITGDITSEGQSEGFDLAREFLTDINRQLVRKLNSDNIIFCPGNHDFIRKEDELEETDILVDVSEYPNSVASYKEFYHSVHHLYPNKFFSCGRKLLI